MHQSPGMLRLRDLPQTSINEVCSDLLTDGLDDGIDLDAPGRAGESTVAPVAGLDPGPVSYPVNGVRAEAHQVDTIEQLGAALQVARMVEAIVFAADDGLTPNQRQGQEPVFADAREHVVGRVPIVD